MRIVLDTNVIVAGLLTPRGAPGRVIDLVLHGDVKPCFDDRILAEYREVLVRPKFGFEPTDVEAVIEYLVEAGEHVVTAPLDVALPDPDDQMFLEVAVAAEADCLITGNVRHFPVKQRRGVHVVSPAEFIDRWTGGR